MVANLAANKERSGHNKALEPTLHASVVGVGSPVILLHGLFGMGSNLGGLARALASDFEVHQLDLPNHGRSSWQENSDLHDLAASVFAYLKNKGLSRVAVVGHSLGGKVAMQMALSWPEHISAVVVADIAPVEYPASHDAVFSAIAAVEAARPKSRSEAGELMQGSVSEPSVVQFLTMSLKRDDEGVYTWRFNASALRDNYENFRQSPTGPVYPGAALFVYGLASDYVDEVGMRAALDLFPRARFQGIPDTGHWLHAEKPQVFNRSVLDFLKQSLGKEGSQG
ncbi:alpha/beta fold hydrolase [Congregibacter variabilis]|uniref:Alpha/beta fold hydrolase n=1 Tax=Congregibacter variabilis TaxID=3081200 RepID=A0ABZ0I5C0_9GAMM|nr:alpha/beta fold hydrolase [Congregibacter sp. IMCC43200]